MKKVSELVDKALEERTCPVCGHAVLGDGAHILDGLGLAQLEHIVESHSSKEELEFLEMDMLQNYITTTLDFW